MTGVAVLFGVFSLCVLSVVACSGGEPGREPPARAPGAPPAGLTAAPSVAWCRDGKPTHLAVQAVALLRGAEEHGLVPADYDTESLSRTMHQLSAARSPAADEAARFERGLAAALERFLTDVHRGRVDARRGGFDYHPAERHRIADVIATAAARGDLADALAEVEPAYPQYRRLMAALPRYRALEVPTGSRVRRIELALERLRWLPHAPSRRFVVVNVPAFRLVAIDRAAGDDPVLVSAVVVGEAARERTPFFIDAVRSVVFRPYWYPPRSIVDREILPALQRDPRYLWRERLDLVARGAADAPVLPPTPENLARLAQGVLALRQQPGPQNTLGLVKFVFPNRYDVYLHDTPVKDLFARTRRDFSHGCIRVQKAADLAAFLLAGTPPWTPETVRAAMDGESTIKVDLSDPVPIFLYYTTAIAHGDGTVEFFEDLYGLDETLDAALRGTARTGPPGDDSGAGR